MTPAARLAAGAALAALGAAVAGAAEHRASRAPSAIGFGPRLLEYPVECVDPRGCRVECFQDGTAVLTRGKIGVQDEIKLFVGANDADEITLRWIEIRPFSGSDVQTLLLGPDTFCDLKALVISPKSRQ